MYQNSTMCHKMDNYSNIQIRRDSFEFSESLRAQETRKSSIKVRLRSHRGHSKLRLGSKISKIYGKHRANDGTVVRGATFINLTG